MEKMDEIVKEKLNELERLIDYNIYLIKDAQETARACKHKLAKREHWIRRLADDIVNGRLRDLESEIRSAANDLRELGVPVTLLTLPCNTLLELCDEIMGFVACDLRKVIPNRAICRRVIHEMAELRYERFVAQGRLLKAFDGEWE